jgi:ribosomal protein S16
MTNRRSYLYNLYIDNATRPRDFDAKAIAEIERYRPAAILINDDPMNVVEASRFSVWASRTATYIREHYRYAGTFRRNEVYLAPGK